MLTLWHKTKSKTPSIAQITKTGQQQGLLLQSLHMMIADLDIWHLSYTFVTLLTDCLPCHLTLKLKQNYYSDK